tara:strand:+ start:350 stop:2416 length:2067 start_codon:yes stop_codon:yes gene_type:complete
MARWLQGQLKRKVVTVRAPGTNPVGAWLHVELTDPEMLAAAATAGNLRVTLSDGVTPVLHKVLGISSTLARIAVAVATPTGAAQVALWVYAGKGEALVPYRTLGPSYSVPASPLTLSYTTAGGAKSESVHPNVLKVPSGSWMKDVSGTDQTVTHVMVDTPYTAWDDDEENPSLMYSTDDGVSWAEWPGITNPIDAFPGGDDYDSDPCLVILASGALRVFYCFSDTLPVHTRYVRFRDVSGDDLTNNVVIGNETTPSAWPDAELPRSPSIIKAGAAEWYLFGQGDDDNSCGDIVRWKSVDEGDNWTDKTTVITSLSGEHADGYWHGSVAGPFSNWYYGLFSEGRNTTSVVASGASNAHGNVRLFRSRDADFSSYEAAVAHAVLRGGSPPTWAQDALYTPTLFEKTDGTLGLLFSGLDNTSDPKTANVGYLAFDPSNTWTTSTLALGHGLTTVAETEATEVATWDLAEGGGSGLSDLTANSHTLVVVGAPTYTADVGYVFLQDGADYLKSDFKLVTLGVDWEVEVEFTIPASIDQDANHMIFGDCANGEQALRVMIVKDSGKVTAATKNEDGDSATIGSAEGSDLRDAAKHTIRIEYKSSASLARLWIDGTFADGTAVTANKTAKDSGAGGLFTLGGTVGAIGGVQFADVTIHRARVASSVPWLHHANFGPEGKWTIGHEDAPARVGRMR